ncbi:MAG: hypothetical protein ACSNEK_10290 [Parachlamydiaceae bacterium]
MSRVPSTTPSRTRIEQWVFPPSHEQPGRQKGHYSLSLRDRIRLRLIEFHHTKWIDKGPFSVSPELFVSLRDHLIEVYQEDIQHHVTARVAALWAQFISVQGTDLDFEIGETVSQVLSAPNLHLVCGGERLTIKYHAAHSSTIPILKAEGIRWLKASHVENINNSTMGLPQVVNQVDCLIDGNARSEGLRQDTICLINDVSHGLLSPAAAMRQFLAVFEKHLKVRLMRLPQQDNRVKVLLLYRQAIQEISQSAAVPLWLKVRHPFFDGLMSVNLTQDEEEDIPLIREILFGEKPFVIQQSNFLETRIHQIIDAYFGPQKPSSQRNCIWHCLAYHANEPLKTNLLKLFSISVDDMSRDPAWCDKLKEEYCEHIWTYLGVLSEIEIAIQQFNRIELIYQANLVKIFSEELRGQACDTLIRDIQTVIGDLIALQNALPYPNDDFIEELKAMDEDTPRMMGELGRILNHEEGWLQKIDPLFLHIVSLALDVSPEHFNVSSFASR